MFGIVNTETGEFWQTPTAKRTWNTKGAAANAFSCHRRSWKCVDGATGEWLDPEPKYTEQTLFKVCTVKLVVDEVLP